jgi:hypothetical protein
MAAIPAVFSNSHTNFKPCEINGSKSLRLSVARRAWFLIAVAAIMQSASDRNAYPWY